MTTIATTPTTTPTLQVSVIERCSLCVNGDDITNPSKELNIPGFEIINNCGTLATFLPALLQNSDPFCVQLQTIGTLCGCPRPQDSCDLCGTAGSPAKYADREIPLQFVTEQFGGIVPTCEIVEAALHSIPTTDDYCLGSQSLFAEYCGCSANAPPVPVILPPEQKCTLCLVEGDQMKYPDKAINITGFPFQTCAQLEEATALLYSTDTINCQNSRFLRLYCGCENDIQDPCPICAIGETFEAPLPDKFLDPRLAEAAIQDTPGLQLTCKILSEMTQTVSKVPLYENDLSPTYCRGLQSVGVECGCPLPENPTCSICDGATPSDDYIPVPGFEFVSCKILPLAFLFLEDGMPVYVPPDNGPIMRFDCLTMQYGGFLCGCPLTYWGADSNAKLDAALWIQRGAATLSLLGSILIIIDVVRNGKFKKSMYSQIVLCLSIFDFLSSIAWGLGPTPSRRLEPADLSPLYAEIEIDESEYPYFRGGHGNDATCRLQGVMLHLGFTSIMYNLCLSIYYKVVIIDGWRERKFEILWIKMAFLGVPALVGLGLALGTIPFIFPSPVGCILSGIKAERKGAWNVLIGLFFIPYGFSFLAVLLISGYIYWKFRKVQRKGRRWSFAVTGSSAFEHNTESVNRSIHHRLQRIIRYKRHKPKPQSSLEKMVLWQSIWYVVGLTMSYSIYFVTLGQDGVDFDAYWFYIIVSILTPLQGFWNALIYFRRRLFSTQSSSPGTGGNNNRFVLFIRGIFEKLFSIIQKCSARLLFMRRSDNDDGNVSEIVLSEEEEIRRRIDEIIAQSGEDPIQMLEASSRVTINEPDNDASHHEEDEEIRHQTAEEGEENRSMIEAEGGGPGLTTERQQQQGTRTASPSQNSGAKTVSTQPSASQPSTRPTNGYLSWSSNFFNMSSEEVVFNSTASSIPGESLVDEVSLIEVDNDNDDDDEEPSISQPTTTHQTRERDISSPLRSVPRSPPSAARPLRNSNSRAFSWSSNFFRISSEEVVFDSVASSAPRESSASSSGDDDDGTHTNGNLDH